MQSTAGGRLTVWELPRTHGDLTATDMYRGSIALLAIARVGAVEVVFLAIMYHHLC